MDEFKTFLFQEDELRTRNKKVMKERTYYIGALIFLIGLLLYLLDLPYVGTFMTVGLIVLTAGQIVLSGRDPSVGHALTTLILNKDSVTIGNDRIIVQDKNNIRIRIHGYKGQLKLHSLGFYGTRSGNDNIIKIQYGEKLAELKFVLNSEHHMDKLIAFCENNGIEFIK